MYKNGNQGVYLSAAFLIVLKYYYKALGSTEVCYATKSTSLVDLVIKFSCKVNIDEINGKVLDAHPLQSHNVMILQ